MPGHTGLKGLFEKLKSLVTTSPEDVRAEIANLEARVEEVETENKAVQGRNSELEALCFMQRACLAKLQGERNADAAEYIPKVIGDAFTITVDKTGRVLTLGLVAEKLTGYSIKDYGGNLSIHSIIRDKKFKNRFEGFARREFSDDVGLQCNFRKADGMLGYFNITLSAGGKGIYYIRLGDKKLYSPVDFASACSRYIHIERGLDDSNVGRVLAEIEGVFSELRQYYVLESIPREKREEVPRLESLPLNVVVDFKDADNFPQGLHAQIKKLATSPSIKLTIINPVSDKIYTRLCSDRDIAPKIYLG